MKGVMKKLTTIILTGACMFGLMSTDIPVSEIGNGVMTVAYAGTSANGGNSGNATDVMGSDLNLSFKTKEGKNGYEASADGYNEDSVAAALNKFVSFIKWVTLVGTLLLLLIFIVNLIKMGTAGTNANARAAAQQAVMWSGISASVLAISSTVFFFINSILK